jgi:MFS transporter, PPP family, 3-phenylpropionic acid transporter
LTSTRALRAYYLGSFASVGIFLPFISPWLAALGVHGIALGWIAATRPLAGVVAPILFGWLADRFGLRGRILRFATLGAFVPFAWLGTVALFGRSPTVTELWLAVGISSFFRVPMMTLADVSALEKSSGYGSSRVYGSIGFMLAALAAGAFIDIRSSSQFPLGVALAFLFAFAFSFGLPLRVDIPQRPTRADVSKLLRRPQYALLLVVTALWAISHVAYDLCISLHLQALGATSLVTSVGWTIGVIAEIAFMSVWDRYKAAFSLERWLLFGLWATVFRWLALSVTSSLTPVLWLQPLHAFSFAVVWMALMELFRERAPRHLLGTGQGMASTSCAIGSTLGMLGFGAIYGTYRGHVTFAIAAAVAMLACAALVAIPALLRMHHAEERADGVAE